MGAAVVGDAWSTGVDYTVRAVRLHRAVPHPRRAGRCGPARAGGGRRQRTLRPRSAAAATPGPEPAIQLSAIQRQANRPLSERGGRATDPCGQAGPPATRRGGRS